MDPGVAISVGDIDVSRLWVYRDVSAAVEGVAAVGLGRLPRYPYGHEYPPIQGALSHRVIAVVGAIERVVRPQGYPVRSSEDTFSPGLQEVTLGVEDYHGVVAPVEGVNTVPGVHPHRRNLSP